MMKSAHVSTPEASLMEYIIVQVMDDPAALADVLINGEKHGTTGSLVTLGTKGSVFVSVDRPTAMERKIYVEDTTAAHPRIVEIRV